MTRIPQPPAPSPEEISNTETITATAFEPSAGGNRGGGGRQRILTITVFSVLGLLGLLAVYLFTGHSVLITFDPEADQISLEGSLLKFKLGDRWLLHTGEYQLSASKAGYFPFQGSIQVSDAPQQEFLFSLERRPGYLSVSTVPEVLSEVRIDGQTAGSTPLQRYELKPGIYQLEVRAERFQPYESELEIIGGGEEEPFQAELIPGWAEVTLASSPAGAALWVNDQLLGETPLTAEILMGTQQLQLRLPGYKTWSQELRIPDNQPMVIPEVQLEQADNLVRLSSNPSRASVTVDGRYRGETPLELELPPGREYQFRFSKAGYQSARRSLQVERSREAQLRVNLPAILGQIYVAGTPADASVYVDGVRRGRINERYQLPARPHQLEIRRDGYQPYRAAITPNPDLEQHIDAKLVSLADIQLARTPRILKTGSGYEMKLVQPSGSIRLGSGRREQGRRANELQRQVRLQKAFYIGSREITNVEFQAFRQSHNSGVVEQETLSLPNQPAVRMSWDDAARFCNWLSLKDGLAPAYVEQEERMTPVQPMTTGYRLPTEAEWTLMARYQGDAGNRAARKYPWGNTLPPAMESGNYAGAEAGRLVEIVISNYRDEFPASAPVGHFPADSQGLYDLGGNVREWIHDYYALSTAGQSAPLDYMGPGQGDNHVIRGASWRSGSLTDLRLAWREQGRSGQADVGFRLARYAE